MKKILVGVLLVSILSTFVFYYKSREVFEQVAKVIEPQAVINQVEIEEDVRVVLKTPRGESIYRDVVTFDSDELKVYWGKKFSNVDSYKNITIKANSKMFREKKIIKITSKGKIQIKGLENSYSGSFYLYKTKQGLVLVNQVSMDDYIAAVISSEMNENFPLEALKAQAICARTYIKNANSETYKAYSADGDDSVAYQAYNKMKPGENCIKAAKETSGLVMTWQGQLIDAFYFSTSCGYTTNYKIWGEEDLGYLRKVCLLDEQTENMSFEKFIKSNPKSYECEYPYYRWNTYLSKTQIENSVWDEYEINIGNLKSVKIEKRGAGGIAAQVMIKGSNREVLVSNQNEIRKVLGNEYSDIILCNNKDTCNMTALPSAFIYIEPVKEKNKLTGIKIYGGGFGHGSGMSQNAAKEMAISGIGYEDILKTFYKDIEITTFQ